MIPVVPGRPLTPGTPDITQKLSGKLSRCQSHSFVEEVAEDDAARPRHIVDRPYFRYVIFSTIFINALQLGLRIEFTSTGWDPVWVISEHIFTAVFTLEMLLKVYYSRLMYFRDGWNVMDFALAWSAILDVWLAPIILKMMSAHSSISFNLSATRLLRIVRVMRITKLFRSSKTLVVLLEGMLASLKGVTWVGLLLLLVYYSGAVLFWQLLHEMTTPDDWEQPYFSDLLSGMLTLFNMSIGSEWEDIVWPLFNSGETGLRLKILIMIAFVCLTQLGFVNIIIGIITDAIQTKGKEKDQKDRSTHVNKIMHQVHKIGEGIRRFDKTGSNGLHVEEFAAMLEEPYLKEVLDEIELPEEFTVEDLHLLMTAGDGNMNGNLSKEELISSFQHLLCANEFQSRCSAALERARILRSVQQLRVSIRQVIHEEVAHAFAQAFQTMKVEVGRGGSTASDGASACRERAPDVVHTQRIEETKPPLASKTISNVVKDHLDHLDQSACGLDWKGTWEAMRPPAAGEGLANAKARLWASTPANGLRWRRHARSTSLPAHSLACVVPAPAQSPQRAGDAFAGLPPTADVAAEYDGRGLAKALSNMPTAPADSNELPPEVTYQALPPRSS
jgi:hypothetical protein